MDFEFSTSLTQSRTECAAQGRSVSTTVRWLGHIAGVALLALPACVSYAPEPLEPPAELQLLQSRAERSVQVDHRGPWLAAWFPLEADVQLADGLTVGEANALALFYSPAILEARADARVAGAQVLQAGVLANPDLFVGPRVSTDDSKLIFPAGISWELPLWGKRDAQREQAGARWGENQLRAIEVELETLRSVREHFLRLARLQSEVAVLATVATSSTQILTWVERLRGAGEVDAVALYLARTERDEASALLERARAQAVRVRRDLFSLLGLLPNAAVTLVVDPSSSRLPELPEASDESLLAVPALRAAEAAYVSMEAALRLEISKQYPDIRFGLEFEDDRGDASIGFGLGITLPLFDRNKGGIAAAEEARQRARARYRATLLRTSHAEAKARDELQAAERLLQIHRQGAMQDADEAARTLEVRLRVGRADVIEVLTAQRAIARGRARLLELEEKVATSRLRAAVAGGLALERPSMAQEEIKK